MSYSLPKKYKALLQLPILSIEDEIALALAVQQGCNQAKTKLVQNNFRFIWKTVKEFNSHIDVGELLQVALLATFKAAVNYSPYTKTRFIAYATKAIKGALASYHVKNLSVIPPCSPLHLKKAYFKVSSDNIAKVAAQTGVKEQTLRIVLIAKNNPSFHITPKFDDIPSPTCQDRIESNERKNCAIKAFEIIEMVGDDLDKALVDAVYMENIPLTEIATFLKIDRAYLQRKLNRLWSKVRKRLG